MLLNVSGTTPTPTTPLAQSRSAEEDRPGTAEERLVDHDDRFL
jgi:hypothetical protein